MPNDNQRKFARVNLRATIRIVFSEVGARRQLLLDNLSAGGLFVRTKQPKPIGTRLTFEFSVRDGGNPILGTGVVKWIEKDPKKVPGMGIQFLELNEEGRLELTEMLDEIEPIPDE